MKLNYLDDLDDRNRAHITNCIAAPMIETKLT